MAPEGVFLTAEWRDLVMLNYRVDPATLTELVPSGCEIDVWNGDTFVSVVGFQFLDTRVLGVPIPLHRDFEEVNLRFYVRRKVEGDWRRGVVFVKELVPRWAIAFVARTVYGENYEALPMRHSIEAKDGLTTVSYGWRSRGQWEGLSATVSGEPTLAPEDAEESFIAEHYWGYSQQRNGSTKEYQVEHPRWRVWRAESATLQVDVAALYGAAFVEPLSQEPTTAFVADGSEVLVRQGRQLA